MRTAQSCLGWALRLPSPVGTAASRASMSERTRASPAFATQPRVRRLARQRGTRWCTPHDGDGQPGDKKAAGNLDARAMSAQDKLLLKLGKNVDSTRAAFAAKVKASEAKEQRMQRGKILSALISVGLGFVIHFVLTHSQLSPTVIMHELEKKNPPIEVALSNGKPTVIEFYADWCTDCKVMAPKLSKLHATFSPTVNFVVVNGDAPENQDLVSQFRVDGIPHISFIYGGKRIPDTTFIGLVPADVMTQQIDALRARAPLPYQGLELYSDEFEEAYGAE